MERKKFKTLLTFGKIGNGKTTLTAAIARILAAINSTEAKTYAELNREINPDYLFWLYFKFGTAKVSYFLIDHPTLPDYLPWMTFNYNSIDPFILVVSAVDGVSWEDRQQVFLLQQFGCSNLVVFLNKEDLLDDDQSLVSTNLEIRRLLDSYGFSASNTPIFIGSAQQALEMMTSFPNTQRGENPWVDKIYQLLDCLDDYINPASLQEVNKPFLMPVEDVFRISGQTIITGRIQKGQVREGDRLEMVGLRDEVTEVTVSGIEMYQQKFEQAIAGDNLGLRLRGFVKKAPHEVSGSKSCGE